MKADSLLEGRDQSAWVCGCLGRMEHERRHGFGVATLRLHTTLRVASCQQTRHGDAQRGSADEPSQEPKT
jgi:hypothetical protein